MEEYLLRTLDCSSRDFLLIYVSSPTVVVGRNQNVFEEVNLPYCKEHAIQVARRVSGGGTVFHDSGNINWTFITSYDGKKLNDYRYFSAPILEALRSMGLHASLNDRNGIEVDGYKLSGQAQFTNRKNLLSHGTLLVHSDINRLNQSITLSDDITVVSKATKSVRSKVSNINDCSERSYSINEVVQKITSYCVGTFEPETASERYKKYVKQYRSTQWIYNRSPKCEINLSVEFSGKKVPVTLTIEKGKVTYVHSKENRIMNDLSVLLLNQDYEKHVLELII